MRATVFFALTCCVIRFSFADEEGDLMHHIRLFQDLLYDPKGNKTRSLEFFSFFLGQVNETCITGEQLQNFSFPVSIKVLTHFIQLRNCEKLSSDLAGILSVREVCPDDFSEILKNIRTNNKRIAFDYEKTCFAGGDIIDSCKADASEIDQVYHKLLIKIMTHNCILPDSGSFLDEIFLMYETQGKNMAIKEFDELLHDLKIGEIQNKKEDHHGGEDDHGEEERAHHDEEEGEEEDHHSEEEDKEEGNHHNKKEEEQEEDHHDEEEGKDPWNEEKKEGDSHYRKRRSEDDHDESKEEAIVADKSVKCYSSDEYISMASYHVGYQNKSVVSKDAFVAICPALMQQVLSGACHSKVEDHEGSSNKIETTDAEKYGYGTVAVFVISLLAFAGIVVIGEIGNDRFKILMQFFIALGIGTLSGDAILHLIPAIVGIHAHGVIDAHAHDENEDKAYLWRLLMVIAGIYIFYLFENFLKLWNKITGIRRMDRNMSENNSSSISTKAESGRVKLDVKSVDSDDIKAYNHYLHRNHRHKHNTSKKPIFWGITSVGVMVWVGDALHRFGDGIALGAAFSNGWVSGVGTSVAVFCHELPHEFGDFAIYLANGMSKWKALFLNFFAACFAFIGLYVGLALGIHGDAREWMLAAVSGMFLHISLVDIMHEMISEKTQRPVLQFIVQNVGLLLGWSIMLLIALFEEDIILALQG